MACRAGAAAQPVLVGGDFSDTLEGSAVVAIAVGAGVWPVCLRLNLSAQKQNLVQLNQAYFPHFRSGSGHA